MIQAFFDGCCEPINPGGTASYGAIIFKEGVTEAIWSESKIFMPGDGFQTSNNVAEYSGFQAILDNLLGMGLEKEQIIVRGDSRLVLCQMFEDAAKKCGYRKKWRILGGQYESLARRCKKLLRQFSSIQGEWIPREENNLADALSKAELHKAGVKFKIQPEG